MGPDEPRIPDLLEIVGAERAAAALERAAAAKARREAAADLQRARELVRRSTSDDLTGAFRRDPGREELAAAVERAQRTGEPLVVAFVDADHLKDLNDERGHAAGDELLRQIGNALRGALRGYDIVVRYGGDEFVCAMPSIRIDDAARRLEEVSSALSRKLPGASVSAGIVALRPRECLDDVIDRADQAMYRHRKRRRTARTGGLGRSSVTEEHGSPRAAARR